MNRFLLCLYTALKNNSLTKMNHYNSLRTVIKNKVITFFTVHVHIVLCVYIIQVSKQRFDPSFCLQHFLPVLNADQFPNNNNEIINLCN